MNRWRWLLGTGLLGATAAAGCSTELPGSHEELAGDLREAHDLLLANCTYTQGFWKNHADAWPVSSLTLGSVSYSKSQLISILQRPVAGNGLIQLAHQLIAAKLNVAQGASRVGDTIAAADALIGSLVVPPVGSGTLPTSTTSGLTSALDSYNTGLTGPGHCGDQPPPPCCGDGNLDAGEACDDGNVTDGDGCSSTCQIETPPPCCGDGNLDAGEACDDGNVTDGDGCSSTCQIEPCH
jgi:cysteine-rich repeat protein